ncbi:carboxypeptidase-like regulatory domain-containing protein [uncultured Gimesia sp.]|uniref:carboxypeptidase-like regulatory domain-containing protein n=1 Tax=uncultured Gimesia sp. TaxID=1678688 RepID=UPI0030D95397
MTYLPFSPSACRQLALTGLLVLFLVGLNSCDHSPGSEKPRSEVTIVITNGSDPVANAQVDLVNEQTGEGGGGTLDDEGKATIIKVALGSYTVTINPPAEEPVIPGIKTAPKLKSSLSIPKQAQKIATSPFKVEVGSGTNEFTFDFEAIEK